MQILSPPFQLTPVGKPICSVQNLQRVMPRNKDAPRRRSFFGKNSHSSGRYQPCFFMIGLTSCGFEGRDQ